LLDHLISQGLAALGIIGSEADIDKSPLVSLRYRCAETVDIIITPVDHDQHPTVGDPVTVAYDSQQPSRAVVLGFESGGVTLRGVGTVLTLVATGIGLIALVTRVSRKRRTGRS